MVAVTLVALATNGCGFHLRGVGGATLPASMSSLRVVPPGTAANDPLTVAVREALLQAGAKIVTSADAPAVVLLREQINTRVASVSTTTAKVSEYLLSYSVGFRLDGPRPIAAQTIRLQRSYSYNPTQVLAREQQRQLLLREMRGDVAQQLVRRLARAGAAQAK